MSEILLVNPRKRRHARSPAQKAATSRMLAARWGKTSHRAKKNPSKRKAHHSFAGHHAAHSRAAKKGWSHRKYRRNPDARGFFKDFFGSELIPAGIGAVGGLGLDLLVGYLPLPAALKTGAMRPVVLIGGAVGLGALAGMMTSKRTGEMVATGAITVVLYDMLKGMIVRNFPNAPLQPTATVVVPTAAALPSSSGVSGGDETVSWYSSSPQVGEYVGEYVGSDDFMYNQYGAGESSVGALVKAY